MLWGGVSIVRRVLTGAESIDVLIAWLGRGDECEAGLLPEAELGSLRVWLSRVCVCVCVMSRSAVHVWMVAGRMPRM